MEIISKLIRQQVFKFILVGGFCSAIEFLIFNILIDHFKIEYLIANIIAVVTAIIINYFLSRRFVFEKSRYSTVNEMIMFFILSFFAIVLNQIILWFFVEILHVNLRVSKALVIVLVAFFNYLTKKYIVFKK